MRYRRNLLLSALLVVCGVVWAAAPTYQWRAVRQTTPVATDADDPAIWIHPQDPQRSLIIATDKGGSLYVFDLRGREVQRIEGLQRPNNVDVEYGLRLGKQRVDIAVVTERGARRLRVYAIDPKTSRLREIGHPEMTRVFVGEPPEHSEPMGIALYRRPKDGAIFAIVSRSAGPEEGYLWQYRLLPDEAGQVTLHKVREFGKFSNKKSIEAVAVDDQLGYVYYADERDGVCKYYADPDHPRASEELARFATTGFDGDREGIAIYTTGRSTGYIVCVDQRKEDSVLFLYPREGTPSGPHDHPLVAVIHTGADDTDGIEVTSRSMGREFPSGLLVSMNSKGKNFLYYRWEQIERAR